MLPALHTLLAVWPWLRCALLAAVALLASWGAAAAEPPARLSDTGLFTPGAPERLRPGVRGFAPQYTLWSDGASKRRWIALPRGAVIDARDADAWRFPRGTRLWKEFAVDGRPLETRYIEHRADGGWTFAAYVWNAAGTEALLAPERGATVAVPDAPGAPGGRYTVPSRGDCLACHGGAPTPVLGFSALQLSSDRDVLAPHAKAALSDDLNLPRLLARGLVRGLPAALAAQPPRIAADSPLERAALGYLHANCSHCHHRAGGQVPVTLTLAQRVAAPAASRAEVLQSLLDAPSRFQLAGQRGHSPVVAPGQPQGSVLVARLQSRQPLIQMPPLGTQVPDAEGLALVQRWITHHLLPRKEP